MERHNGIAADASWSDDGSGYNWLYVVKSDIGTDVYISMCNERGCEFGYVFSTENIFDMDKKLKSAILSTTNIDLTYIDFADPSAGYTRTVSIQAIWEGTGDITKDSYK